MDNLGLFAKFLMPNRLELRSIFPFFMEWANDLHFFFSFPLGLMAYILFESQNKLTSRVSPVSCNGFSTNHIFVLDQDA